MNKNDWWQIINFYAWLLLFNKGLKYISYVVKNNDQLQLISNQSK